MEPAEEPGDRRAEMKIQALKGDVAALKATKAMKAWPVKPFVLTSFGLSDLSS